ncbi:hypothetical protein ACN9ML_29295 [Dyadobacter endophyticus]|uniref:hypothetical protein n=1 Tax=Dyadobacter endophyticus TaxID=1749036 RepID=UPI003CF3A2C8
MKINLYLIALILLSACNPKPGLQENHLPAVKRLKKFHNIIIAIDLSKRLENSAQANRDLKIIDHILKKFEQRQIAMGYIKSKDRLSLVILGSSNPNENGPSSLDMATDGMNKVVFDQQKKSFQESLKRIYSEAKVQPQKRPDTWTFFRDRISSYLKSSDEKEGFSNKMIVLTDGYLSVEGENAKLRRHNTYMAMPDIERMRNMKDWEHIFVQNNYKLEPHDKKDYKNLEVLMLEVNPIDPDIYSNEYKILEKYWKTWFSDMGVDFEMKPVDNPDVISSLITEFLERSGLYASMALPVPLVGENYKCELVENPEIVKGFRGKYFLLNIYEMEHQKSLNFIPGSYVTDINRYMPSLGEFGSEVIRTLNNSNFKGMFKIFVKGSADSLGNLSFSRSFEKNHIYNKVCYYSRFKDANYLFTGDVKCDTMIEPLKNSNLPNLRAQFIKEKFMAFYGTTMDEPIVLDGRVTLDISEMDRSATIFLFLPSNFFD